MDTVRIIHSMYRTYSMVHPEYTNNPYRHGTAWQMPRALAEDIVKRYTEPAMNPHRPAFQLDDEHITFLGIPIVFIDKDEVNLVIKVT